MSLKAPSAVHAIVSPGNVPGLRKLLVKLTLMRAGNTAETQDEVDASTLAHDLEIPSSLVGIGQFVRLSEIADVAKGPTGIKDARPGPYPLVVTAEDRGSCDHYDLEGEAILIPTVSSTGHGDASLKRIHSQEGRFAVGSILAAVQVRDRASHSARFLYEYLSVFKDELLVARMSGTANVSLTVKKIEGVPIPLIPIAQQQHLHDLMRLCDALEAKGRLEAEQQARLLGTLLGTLTDSSTPEELAVNWQRIADHFDLLLDRPEAVDALEQTVLQLAVRGLLVPQDPSDEPAAKLLQRIRHEQSELRFKRLIRRERSDSVPNSDEPPFSIPLAWEWTKMTGVAIKVTDGEHISPVKAPSGMKLLTAKHVTDKGVSLAEPQFVSEQDGLRFRERCDPAPGDILICSRGTIGRAAIVDTSEIFCLMGSVILLKPCKEMDSQYLHIYLSTDFSQALMRGMSFATAVSALYLKDIKACPIPVPPLAEQRRIVARVTEVRRLCADLRQRLIASQTTQSRLAEALVEEVT